MDSKRLIPGVGAAVLVAGGLLVGSPSYAQQPCGTLDDAIAAALAVVPGTVLEVEQEREDGQVVYEIEVRQANGQVVEVEVGASLCQVLETEVDDDDDDDDDDD